MNTCAIVELEEAALSITVAALRGRRVQVVRNVHVPIPDLEPSTLVSILSSLRSDVLRGIAAVQVILGDRRMHHFRCEVPAMPVADVEQFVRREAMRLTGLPSVDDVLIAVNRLRRTSNGALRIAATALPRAVWDTLHKSFVEAGVTVAGLCSLENCLALLAPTAAPTAVVECGVGRTRFLLCEDRVVCQVRRFIVGASAGGNSEAVGAQLSLELPRTLEWLRESGNGVPTSMLLGPRAAAGIRAIGMDLDGLPPVVVREHGVPVKEGETEPTIACTTLLRAIATGGAPPSLLAPLRLELPITGRRVLLLAAAVAVAGFAGWSAMSDFGRWRVAEEHVAELSVTAAEVERTVRSLQQAEAAATGAAEVQDGRLRSALGNRRPVSLLLADLARHAGSVRLDAVDTTGDDKVTLSGFVTAASRRDALEEVARFLREVRELPYLVPSTGEDIGELPGMLHGFRFQVGFSWRSS
ncbi:MAG: hypothetical protein H6838_14240 [Planctomycetes bacterium]|nr:hypothetical protein [Planctomycetota bacterium]